jgi:phosphoribosylaminoimidazole (AIR) synthetase
MSKEAISYRDAGVDIDAGDALVEAIKPFAAASARCARCRRNTASRCWCRAPTASARS